MKILLRSCIATLIAGLVPAASLALPPIPGGGSQNGARLPDDQVEGTIWEYRGTLQSKPAGADAESELRGKFRIEGTAVFAVSQTIDLPSREEVKEVVDDVRRGKGIQLKVPTAAQQKRIGQYRKISRSRRRFDFDDPDSLHGIMIVRPKKGTSDVWIGTYDQKQGKKTVGQWDVEIRPIED